MFYCQHRPVGCWTDAPQEWQGAASVSEDFWVSGKILLGDCLRLLPHALDPQTLPNLDTSSRDPMSTSLLEGEAAVGFCHFLWEVTFSFISEFSSLV